MQLEIQAEISQYAKELQVSYGEIHRGRQIFLKGLHANSKKFLSSLERRRRISRISRDIQKAMKMSEQRTLSILFLGAQTSCLSLLTGKEI